MNPVIAVTVLALIQFIFFGALVAVARKTQGVAAPAMTGSEVFDRLSRVHLNTQERLVLFLPLMWLAAQFWNPIWAAGAGMVFLIGRMVYWRGYVQHPDKRMLGNLLTMLPTGLLLLVTLAGLARSALA